MDFSKLSKWTKYQYYFVKSFYDPLPDSLTIINNLIVSVPNSSNSYINICGKDFNWLKDLHNKIFKVIDATELRFNSFKEAQDHIDDFILNIEKYKKLQGFI